MSRRMKTMVVVALAAIALLVLPYQLSPGKRFTRRPVIYFEDFAAACDHLLDIIEVPTNGVTQVDPVSIETPSIIRRIRPNVIEVSSKRVWVLAGSGHVGGYAVIWAPDETDSSRWSLKIANDALDETLYTRKIGVQHGTVPASAFAPSGER